MRLNCVQKARRVNIYAQATQRYTPRAVRSSYRRASVCRGRPRRAEIAPYSRACDRQKSTRGHAKEREKQHSTEAKSETNNLRALQSHKTVPRNGFAPNNMVLNVKTSEHVSLGRVSGSIWKFTPPSDAYGTNTLLNLM